MSVIFGTDNNDTITPAMITTGVFGFPTAFPSAEQDELHGLSGSDVLESGAGDDYIFGDDDEFDLGNDILNGGLGADQMYGRDGNDIYYVDNAGDFVNEINDTAIGGTDTVRSTLSLSLGSLFSIENLTLLGNAHLTGTGSVRANVLTGNTGNNVLNGGAGNDSLLGGNGSDTLDGGGDRDTVRGQGGNDILRGGALADVLIGGSGNDVFDFRFAGDSAPAAVDQISAGDGAVAFNGIGSGAGDLIRLAEIDANAMIAGNQAFGFSGTSGSTGIGRLSLTAVSGDTIVRGNTDADAAFEFQLVIHDGSTLSSAYTASDFIL